MQLKKSNNRNAFPLAAAAILLTAIYGCKSYQPKAGEQAAKLRFTTFSRDFTYLYIQDADACPDRKQLIMQHIDDINLVTPPRIGMIGTAESGSRQYMELHIPAEKTLYGTLAVGLSSSPYVQTRSCSFGFSFKAKANAQYEIQYRETEKQCSARLHELKELSTGEVIRVPEPSFQTFPAKYAQSACSRRFQ